MSKRVLNGVISLGLAWAVLGGAEVAAQSAYRTEMVAMRDGVRLNTSIYLPEGDGPWPVLLVRTPYRFEPRHMDWRGRLFPAKGFALVLQDVRGRNGSEGTFEPHVHEGNDGFDTMAWISRQVWCGGRIGMMGSSYDGIAQWMAAPLSHPSMVAMAPVFAMADPYPTIYRGGALQLGLSAGFATLTTGPSGWDTTAYDWPTVLRVLPLRNWDVKAIGREMPSLRKTLANPSSGPHWDAVSVGDRYDRIWARGLHVSGWYDLYPAETIRSFNRMRAEGPTQAVREGQRLLIGPWGHTIPRSGKVGDLEFGAHSYVDLGQLQIAWFDATLKDRDNGMFRTPPIRIFVMGENVWRDEEEWPLARAVRTPYYLRAAGAKAKGRRGLSTTAPANDRPDRFSYNPKDPAPTAGGANVIVAPDGPRDQQEVEKRKDVLVYTSEPLAAPLEVTGPIEAVLFASSSAKDTDFTVKLVDVHPSGAAYLVTDGIVRARYRESRTSPTLITPNKVTRYTVDVGVTSQVFLKGHRIRVEVSSSNFPRFDRNPNTGRPFGQDSLLTTARQVIYHDRQRPSHVVLPVVR